MLVVKLGEGHKGESLLLSPGFRRGRNIEKARLDNREMYYLIIYVIGLFSSVWHFRTRRGIQQRAIRLKKLTWASTMC